MVTEALETRWRTTLTARPGAGSLDRENDAQLIEALDILRNPPAMHSRAAD